MPGKRWAILVIVCCFCFSPNFVKAQSYNPAPPSAATTSPPDAAAASPDSDGRNDIPQASQALARPELIPTYIWRVTSVAGGAQLLTLFEGHKNDPHPEVNDIPLVSVLRDSLGDSDSQNDKLRYVWLLPSAQPTVIKRILAAIPFFYWRAGPDPRKVGHGMPKPLADISNPQRPVWNALGQDIVQSAVLNPLAIPVRASTRAYRTNAYDQGRLRLQETIGLMQGAPTGLASEALTLDEQKSSVERLYLRKELLGGLVQEKGIRRSSETRTTMDNSFRGRDWELLRISAERAGLYFEPVQLNGSAKDYGVIWFPQERTFDPAGVAIKKTWKLLQISDPWHDARLSHWDGFEQTRSFDADGRLLPLGVQGSSDMALVPLAIYSMSYDRQPLLLVDFRDQLKTKRRELTQRMSEDFFSGILGVSPVSNWYYYISSDGLDFLRTRRGSPTDREARLDSYYELRCALQLDRTLDEGFRTQLRRRLGTLSTNPLESSPEHELGMARAQYDALQAAAGDPRQIQARLWKDRRSELAAFGEGKRATASWTAAHVVTLGIFTHRVPAAEASLEELDRDRRTMNLLRYLDEVAQAGPSPEVTYGEPAIASSIVELSDLVSTDSPSTIRKQASQRISRMQSLVHDASLYADCQEFLERMSLQMVATVAANRQRAPAQGSDPSLPDLDSKDRKSSR